MNKIFLTLIFIATPTFAQELNEFSNGSVADADAINENFQNLNDRIKTIEEAGGGGGGCSAEQDGSNVVITCADGSTGVLASAGTVVRYPMGAIDGPVEEFRTGDIVLRDGNGVVLGRIVYLRSSFVCDPVLYLGEFGENNPAEGFLQESGYLCVENMPGTEDVLVRSIMQLDRVPTYFQSTDCTGAPFANHTHPFILPGSEADWVVIAEGILRSEILVKSKFQVGGPDATCEEISPIAETGHFFRRFTLPSELHAPAFPVELEQLP